MLVLGGAALGKACGEPASKSPGTKQETPVAGTNSREPVGGSSPVNGGSAADAGGTVSGAGSAGTGAGGAGPASGGVPTAGTSGSVSVGGVAEEDGGVSGSSAGSESAGGAGGGAGEPATLECRVRENGVGHAADPCGCPCCWAKDCLNTDETCCVGFCKGADEGRGCCGL